MSLYHTQQLIQRAADKYGLAYEELLDLLVTKQVSYTVLDSVASTAFDDGYMAAACDPMFIAADMSDRRPVVVHVPVAVARPAQSQAIPAKPASAPAPNSAATPRRVENNNGKALPSLPRAA